ncbi:MAG: 2-oxoacid:acceptor oxidoreductase subunit alpha [Bdellovibrionaceae bacterium]|nr:2-oxoacid:acceptor oxidoreductase subunit alpha [Pseudobdellovibrionaceae bacterium]
MNTVNNFVINIGTLNGSGSQSSNNVLVRSLFHMGLPVCGKNLFPSNIAGLPTWFAIRISAKGHLSRKQENDIVIGMNAATLIKDQINTKKGGVFIYNSDLKVPLFQEREDVTCIAISFKEIVDTVTPSVKLKKLLTNMVYVGVVAQLIDIDKDILISTVKKLFSDKPQVIESNINAIEAGWNYSHSQINISNFPFKVKSLKDANKDKILIDGNTASALGLLFGGCSFMAWYPITPSSSVAENFHAYAEKYRKDKNGKNNFAVVQAEDELAAISMVLGAGWSGARAVTPTSGPGLSLMSEAAGFSYFAEIPAVIWDVQRVGPSTGLPTRTMQGDLTSAYYLSHGDTKHIVLLPSSPEECFEFGQTCFDLAERLQTLVIVLSDLDLGMNFWISDNFKTSKKPLDRGKVYGEKELENNPHFARYADVDGDGITYRTLPGTYHPQAAFFTRGTGHDEKANYSEDNLIFKKQMDRLTRKLETAKPLLPQPIARGEGSLGLIAYGSSHSAVVELQDLLSDIKISSRYLRIRALPIVEEVKKFIEKQSMTYIIEQNRDAQLCHLILSEWPELYHKIKSIVQYDGLPLSADYLYEKINKTENLS